MILVAVASCPHATGPGGNWREEERERVAGPHRPPSGGDLAPYPPASGPYRPGGRTASDYGYHRPARRPRRTAGGVIAAALGGIAALTVVAVLGFWLAGTGDKPRTRIDDGSRLRAGSKTAALSGPLYRSGPLSPVGCRLPAITEHDEESMRRFLDTLSNCLDQAWDRQFAKAGISGFTAPQRVFWSMPGSSPCGSYPAPGASAFYCPVNDTMYVGLSNVVETAGGEPVSHYAVYARVIAHEYGHHVQEDAGILEYGHELMASGGPARAEASRRIELQAQCFAGAFLSAERRTLPMTRAQYREMIADTRARGDDESRPGLGDHGSGRHYAGWVIRGYGRGALSACDTWTAPSSGVS